MALLSQRSPMNLGVAKIPPQLRLPGQLEEMINAISTLGGTYRRQPTEHVAQLIAVDTGYEDGFTHLLEIGSDRYLVVVVNDDLKVYNADTGVEQTVEFPDGKGYLSDSSAGFRAISVDNKVYLLNRAVEVEKSTTQSPAQSKEALVTVQQGGSPEIKYSVTINGIQVSYTTPDSLDAAFETNSTTDFIADALFDLLVASAALSGFTFELYGSTIYMVNDNGSDFSIQTFDGLGDEALQVVKGSVQRFEDLPKRAKDGIQVEVVGDDDTTLDNFWVTYDDQGNPSQAGVWRESVKPGLLTDFLGSTMPHELGFGASLLDEFEVGLDWVGGGPTISDGGTNSTRVEILNPEVGTIPDGVTVTLTIDGIDFDYTATGGDKVWADAFTAWQADIDAHADYICIIAGAGEFLVQDASATADPVIVYSTDFDPETMCYAPSLSLVADELVGDTIENATDGSTGVVTSNTTTLIRVSAGLSGGGDNRFDWPDSIRITQAGDYFVFSEAEWASREAGDDETCPFPSFVDGVLYDIEVNQGRLGVTGKAGSIVLSRAGKPLNFFRQSARELLADDPIDVKQAQRAQVTWHSMVPWNGALYLFSDRAQARLSGDPVLTPTTVRLDPAGAYSVAPDPKPLEVGESIFFARQKTRGALEGTQIEEYRVTGASGESSATDLTVFIPTYLIGSPELIEGDSALGMVLVKTDLPNALYVFTYHDVNGQRVLASWSRWDFAYGTHIIGMHLYSGTLRLVVRHSDGIYLEKVPLAAPETVPWWRFDGEAGADGEATPL